LWKGSTYSLLHKPGYSVELKIKKINNFRRIATGYGLDDQEGLEFESW
jgi:hypothetical protein